MDCIGLMRGGGCCCCCAGFLDCQLDGTGAEGVLEGTDALVRLGSVAKLPRVAPSRFTPTAEALPLRGESDTGMASLALVGFGKLRSLPDLDLIEKN